MERSSDSNRKRKNVRLIEEINELGEHIPRLIHLSDGRDDPSFRAFIHELRKKRVKLNTLMRYAYVLAMHIDYLIEIGVYGDDIGLDVTAAKVQSAIEEYIVILERADKLQSKRLNQIVQELNITRQSPSSFNSVIAALNTFYRLSERIARTARQRAKRLWPELPDLDDFEALNIGLSDRPDFTEWEKKKLRQRSVLGGVIRWHGEIARPKSIPAPKKLGKRSIYPFRLGDIQPLLDAATTYRDRLLWMILIAGGPRPSECLQLRVSDIDHRNRTVYVPNDEEVKVHVSLTEEERVRFKGRNIRKLWLLPGAFTTTLFQYYKEYMLREYVPTKEHPFLFQYVTSKPVHGIKRGDPYWNPSRSTTLEIFRGAIRRAGIHPPEEKPNNQWALYSLRHFYCDYLYNEFPDENGNREGLSLSGVQLCAGHEEMSSTQVYSRESEKKLKQRFLLADAAIHQIEGGIPGIAVYTARQLRDQASKLEGLAQDILANKSKREK